MAYFKQIENHPFTHLQKTTETMAIIHSHITLLAARPGRMKRKGQSPWKRYFVLFIVGMFICTESHSGH